MGISLRLKHFLFLSLLVGLPLKATYAFTIADVLYVGDSHSLLELKHTEPAKKRLGHEIIESADLFEKSLNYFAACDSRPSTWMEKQTYSTCGVTSYFTGAQLGFQQRGYVPNFKTAIEQGRPKLVLININDKVFNVRELDEIKVLKAPVESSKPKRSAVIAEIQSMINVIPKETKCVWIGPTYHTEGSVYRKGNDEVDSYYALLKQAIGSRCKILDGRPLFDETNPNDGLHLINSESIKWGKAISSYLNGH